MAIEYKRMSGTLWTELERKPMCVACTCLGPWRPASTWGLLRRRGPSSGMILPLLEPSTSYKATLLRYSVD